MMSYKKCITPVIAVVLLIVIVVTVSLIVYVWSSGFVSEKTGTKSNIGDYTFLVESQWQCGEDIIDYYGNGSLTWDGWICYIRNTGKDIKMETSGNLDVDYPGDFFDVYVDGVMGVFDDEDAGHDDNEFGILLQEDDDVWNHNEVAVFFNRDITTPLDNLANINAVKFVHRESGTQFIVKK